jgi:Fe-S cluster biogenesis protein NfuA
VTKPPDRKIKIIAEPSLDPRICKFIVDQPVCPGRSINCRKKEMAEGSPLLEALFEIEGIREVHVSEDTLTVARSTDDDWRPMGKRIGSVIRALITSGKSLIPEDFKLEVQVGDDLIRQIQQIIETRVNPGIASHGGRAELVDVKGTSVYIRMSGGCLGCGAAGITLRHGIERTIRSAFPEVTEVIDVSDHSAGKNPYYKPGRDAAEPYPEHGGGLIED